MVLLDWIGQRMFRLFAEPCVAFLEAKRQKLSMKSLVILLRLIYPKKSEKKVDSKSAEGVVIACYYNSMYKI